MLSSNNTDGLNLEKLFFPRSIGIIGASHNPSGGGFFVRCLKNRYRGPIYLFNPRLSGKQLYGYEIKSSILEISDFIAYRILAVPARLCPKILEEIGQKEVPFVTIFASGFREVGNEDLEKELLHIAKNYNIRIIGPNCIGVYNPKGSLYFAFEQSRKSGNFGGIFQSGGIAQNLAQLGVSYGLYISKFISIGNALDLSPVEFLEYFLHDDQTKIIGLYIENLRSIEQGRNFMKIVQNCNLNRKPVILWRVGYGEATKKAIISHTGGLAGNNAIWKAVGKQTGCCIVNNSNELAERFGGFQEILEEMGFKDTDLNKEFIRYISKAKSVCTKPMFCVMLKINEGFEEYKSRYKFKLKLLNRKIPIYENLNLTAQVLDKLNTYREFLQKHGKYPNN
ncbi:hypothetical protein LCGC14_1290260 [marine sediment metagenome]|uniref:CoA-binding domain-containing protein n=1 Tax=marine sediment metagenome TaxID=412755 RepID=A0A0F9LDK9_9ZZZZ